MAEPAPNPAFRPRHLALVGNPNTGKTSLFNRLCGLRAQTANFPGSTVEARRGMSRRGDVECQIIDLPGHYGLGLERPESVVCRDYLAGRMPGHPAPEAVIVVVDATNLPRNLVVALQTLRLGLPAVVAVNMIDLARRGGLSIDEHALAARLGCPVVATCARTGEGVDRLAAAVTEARIASGPWPAASDEEAVARWADEVIAESVGGDDAIGGPDDTLTDRLDAAFTHPVLGLVVFGAVMVGVFWAIFTLASVPMDLIELAFGEIGAGLAAVLPEGAIRDLLVDGVVGGVAGTVVFLPQICLLFFLISLLEDTGYLARASFVMDRVMRRFGLPGQSFVPLLSAHACAIPAIMSARLVPDRRDRLATILVAPFMSCSARMPVYVLLIGMLWADAPVAAGIAFAGCYALGAGAAILTALLLRGTILRGRSAPMVLELPAYRRPSLRAALLTTWDRAVLFLRKAGTIILGICMVLWWLGAYPQVEAPAAAVEMRAEAARIADVEPERAETMSIEADRLEARHATTESFAGHLGRAIEPVFAPLGYDWQLSIGVVSSFAAREVFVSTMAVVLTGTDEDPAEDVDLRARIGGAERSDGTPIFNRATTASLLVFYVLALQCLPTLAVTRRETGRWGWALLQFAYMTGVAYAAALLTYRVVLWFGG